jgi:hypothetical protein
MAEAEPQNKPAELNEDDWKEIIKLNWNEYQRKSILILWNAKNVPQRQFKIFPSGRVAGVKGVQAFNYHFRKANLPYRLRSRREKKNLIFFLTKE